MPRAEVNAAYAGVTTWHYFLTDLVYVEADGTEIECYKNIDVKQNESGHWFYSFAIEKGSRPADVLSVVTDKSATTSTISVTENAEKSNTSDENFSKNSRRSSSETIENVAKSRYTEPDVKFSEKIKAKFTSVKDKLYIDAVDEMWGIEKYLKEKGGVKDYAAVVQQVRASETIAQTMIGVAQYDITESGKGKRLGDGITKIFKKYHVRKIEADFNDYLLHQLNVDRMTLRERSLEWQEEKICQ